LAVGKGVDAEVQQQKQKSREDNEALLLQIHILYGILAALVIYLATTSILRRS
jgi:hypothetical protein